MSTAFAITAAASSVTLVDRAATGTFSVTSNLPAPVRAQARLWTAAPVTASWITLDGTAVRQLAPGATESFQVSFRPGPEVPPGTYQYRLDVVDADNPDDHGTEGPVGTVTVPDAPPPPAKKPFPWWIVALAAALLVLLGALAYALSRDPEPRAVPAPGPVRTAGPAPTRIRPPLLVWSVYAHSDGVTLKADFPLIGGDDELDLDTMSVGETGGDLRFVSGTLHAVNGGALQPRGAGPFPMGGRACARGFAAAGEAPVATGQRFCARTSDGRVAEATVTESDTAYVVLNVVVYEQGPGTG